MPLPIQGTTMHAEQLDGGLMLVVHGEQDPSAEEWERYCDYAGAARSAAGGKLRTLVITRWDKGPDAKQRSVYSHKVAGADNRVAVLCAGRMTRTILTAMSWFNPDMSAFDVEQLDAALRYLEAAAPPSLSATIDQATQRLQGARSQAG